jgi:hypothetical protein
MVTDHPFVRRVSPLRCDIGVVPSAEVVVTTAIAASEAQ